MSESKLRELSMEFSVEIIELVKYLKSIKESIISNQIGRSGTSIGANIHEAQYAQGKKDFISKLEIALKEASETGYWLELLFKTGYIEEIAYRSLDSRCTSIRVMLISSINTLKKNKDGSFEIEKELNETAQALEDALSQYGINGKIVKVRPGPVVTLYEL